MRPILRFAVLCARFRDDTGGTIALLYAGTLLLMVGFVALAVDGARAHMLRSQLHFAVDAAAIAIGKEMKTLDNAALLTLAERYVKANVEPASLGVQSWSPGDLVVSLHEGGTDGQKEIRATAKLRTTLLGLVDGADIVTIGRSAMVQREVRGMELAFSLDVTGSMAWSSNSPGQTRIEALKIAATDLLDIFFGENETHPKVYISVVPFTRDIQAQTNIEWVKSNTMSPPLPNGHYNESYSWNPEPDFAGGDSVCYGKRSTQALREGVQPPNSEENKFPAHYEYKYEYRGYWHYKYRYWVSIDSGFECPDVDHTILPLTNVRADIQSHIDALVPHGGTATDRGAVWGWRTLSSDWRGYWDISDQARPYDITEPHNDKVLVLMTDGENNHSSSDSALARICENIKAAGVTVVSINFATPEHLYPLYRNCASSPDLFFPAATGEQLRNTFRAIALQLSVLRLIK